MVKGNLNMVAVLILLTSCGEKDTHKREEVPLIVITDLYHPHQDPGDNLELINAYALSGLDLKAVILDCHEPFRHEIAKGVWKGLFEDPNGPREPGYICMHQLNYLFGRNVPYGVGPFEPTVSFEDKMERNNEYQNQGLDLLKKTLEEASQPMSIASFGSSRVLSVAFNRYPDLMRKKINRIHLSAGTSGNHPEYLEWNVALDTLAFVNLMESGLPISLYPCASGRKVEEGKQLANAFLKDSNNTYYQLKSLSFIDEMETGLRQYCYSIFKPFEGNNYLGYLEKKVPRDSTILAKSHHVWESAIWMQLANLKLIKDRNGNIRIVPESEVEGGDEVYQEKMVRCRANIKPSGLFEYKYDSKGSFLIYERGDVERYEKWMNQAIPIYYKLLMLNK
jgi:hypothetical protein